MDAIKLLTDLSESWDVDLISYEVGPSATEWQLTLRTNESEHSFRGPLIAVLARAAPHVGQGSTPGKGR